MQYLGFYDDFCSFQWGAQTVGMGPMGVGGAPSDMSRGVMNGQYLHSK